MFTGLIEDVGLLESVTRSSSGHTLEIRSRFSDLKEGESVAVNGACLTVLRQTAGLFTVAAVVTTLGRTTIGEWNRGKRINLERAMRADGRLGGHIVQGQVDGVGSVVSTERTRDALLIEIDIPDALSESVILHGS